MIRFLALAAFAWLSAQSPALRSSQALLFDSGIHWRSLAAPGVRLHAQRHAPAEAALDRLREEAQHAIATVLALLEESEPPPLDLFYVDSRDTMERLVGARPKALSVPQARYAMFVFNAGVEAHHRHEIAHVLAAHFWGPAARPAHWINEGLAHFAAGACDGIPLDPLASALQREERVPALDELVFGFGTEPPLEAGVLAGSFVGFLTRRFGLGRVRALWRHGVDRFEALFGLTLAEAEAAWRRELTSVPAADRDLARLRGSGCG